MPGIGCSNQVIRRGLAEMLIQKVSWLKNQTPITKIK